MAAAAKVGLAGRVAFTAHRVTRINLTIQSNGTADAVGTVALFLWTHGATKRLAALGLGFEQEECPEILQKVIIHVVGVLDTAEHLVISYLRVPELLPGSSGRGAGFGKQEDRDAPSHLLVHRRLAAAPSLPADEAGPHLPAVPHAVALEAPGPGIGDGARQTAHLPDGAAAAPVRRVGPPVAHAGRPAAWGGAEHVLDRGADLAALAVVIALAALRVRARRRQELRPGAGAVNIVSADRVIADPRPPAS